MLVQSTAEDLYLLPALPRDKWANGCVKGLKARGKLTVNICWKEGDLREVGLWSNEQNSLKRLHYRGTTVKANLSPGRVYTFNRTLKCIKKQPLPSAASCWMLRFKQFFERKNIELSWINLPRNYRFFPGYHYFSLRNLLSLSLLLLFIILNDSFWPDILKD